MAIKLKNLLPSDWEGTHICFLSMPAKPTKKTDVWGVYSETGFDLGKVKWFGQWGKYCFFPNLNCEIDCVFEEVCLQEIGQFIADRTKEYKSKLTP